MTLCRQIRIMDLHDDVATFAVYDIAHIVGQAPTEVIAAEYRHGIAEIPRTSASRADP